ncbi:hypothetical protein X975_16461, partial [Stegodyphus mimosarum]
MITRSNNRVRDIFFRIVLFQNSIHFLQDGVLMMTEGTNGGR